MADTRTETPADEMREAAARLRKIGAAASRPPWRRDGMAIATGSSLAALAYNGVDADWIELAAPGLAEPLASWLEEVAAEAERHEAQGMGNAQDEIIHGPCLAVARVLNGGPS